MKTVVQVKQRRDICFSQALTALVASLVSRLWCRPPDPLFLSVLSSLGPVVCFEGLLSMHGEDVTTFNDMIVAIEDLRAVEFGLVVVEAAVAGSLGGAGDRVASVSSYPLPRVTGSRAHMRSHISVILAFCSLYNCSIFSTTHLMR